jgi:hypothetical protein
MEKVHKLSDSHYHFSKASICPRLTLLFLLMLFWILHIIFLLTHCNIFRSECFYIVIGSSSGSAVDMFKAELDSNLYWTTEFSFCYDFPNDSRDKFEQKVLQLSKSSCIREISTSLGAI